MPDQRFSTNGFLEGVHYTLSDSGKVRPIVRGGSDVPPADAPTTFGGAAEALAASLDAPEASEAPAEGSETPPEAPATPETAPESPNSTENGTVVPESEPKVFDEKYVRELRDEAAKHRTDYAPFRDAFKDYDPASRDVMLELAQNLIVAPEDAGAKLIEIARNIYGDKFDEVVRDDTPKPLTQADLDKQLSEREATREAEARQKAELQAVVSQATSLGYTEGTADYADLMFRAFNEFEGDLDKSHAAREAGKQAIIDAYLADKTEKNGQFPPVSSGEGGAAAEKVEAPKSWSDASSRLTAALGKSLGN